MSHFSPDCEVQRNLLKSVERDGVWVEFNAGGGEEEASSIYLTPLPLLIQPETVVDGSRLIICLVSLSSIGKLVEQR